MGREYELIVYGATWAGLGWALAAQDRGQSVAVVESTKRVGAEFIHSLTPGEGWHEAPRSQRALALRAELLERNLLTPEGRIHLPGLTPVLFEWVHRYQVDLWLMTEVIEVASADTAGYSLTVYNASGLLQLQALTLVDTTWSARLCHGVTPRIREKRIGAFISPELGSLPHAPTLGEPGVELISGRFPGEVIFKLTVGSTDDWVQARRRLHDYWVSRPAELRPWTLTAVADEFDVALEDRPMALNSHQIWFPSKSCSNPLGAFDQGYLAGQGERGIRGGGDGATVSS